MSVQPDFKWTPTTYLEFERESEVKHEYFQGEIFAMAGASTNHNRLVTSIVHYLYPKLGKKGCDILANDMRVKVSQTGLYTYPDILIACGELHYDDDQKDTLLNPLIIFEVLSPSTESYDRGKKFESYRTLDSLQEYLLISQDKIHIEHYVRQSDKEWQFIDITQSGDVFTLPSIACEVSVKDIYERVEFDTESKTDETPKD